MSDVTMRVFADLDLYSRYDSDHRIWLDDRADPDGPWQQEVAGMLPSRAMYRTALKETT